MSTENGEDVRRLGTLTVRIINAESIQSTSLTTAGLLQAFQTGMREFFNWTHQLNTTGLFGQVFPLFGQSLGSALTGNPSVPERPRSDEGGEETGDRLRRRRRGHLSK